jgi:hypothetical protein
VFYGILVISAMDGLCLRVDTENKAVGGRRILNRTNKIVLICLINTKQMSSHCKFVQNITLLRSEKTNFSFYFMVALDTFFNVNIIALLSCYVDVEKYILGITEDKY